MPQFDWVKPYEKIATALLDYEGRRGELAALAGDILDDSFQTMDPLTFFSMFNGKMKRADRRSDAVARVLEFLGIEEETPHDFSGLPVTNPLRWRFWDGNASSVDNDWRVFKAALEYADHPDEASARELAGLFDVVRAQGNVGDATLTMALYWARPKTFLPLDDNTVRYLRNCYGLTVKLPTNGNDYLDLLGKAKAQIRKPLYQFSYEAWEAGGWFPAPSVYTPKVSADMWASLLRDKAVSTQNVQKTLKALYAKPKGATCAQLADEFGESASLYNVSVQKLGRDAMKVFGIPSWEGTTNKYWYVPCLGSQAEKGAHGNFMWRLRPELRKALEDAGLVSAGARGNANDTDTNEGDMEETKAGGRAPAGGRPKNLILYGPPGTGKTYHTRSLAVEIIDGSAPAAPADLQRRYRELCGQNRIRFVTFHQSFSYEDFVQGIRPDIQDDAVDEDATRLRYRVADGVFKDFCDKARLGVASTEGKSLLNDSPKVWKVSLMGTGDNPVRAECLANGHVRVGFDGLVPTAEGIPDGEGAAVLRALYERMSVGDLVCSCYHENETDAIGVVTSEARREESYQSYKSVRDVKWLWRMSDHGNVPLDVRKINGGVKMTLATIYELKRMSAPDLLELAGVSVTDLVEGKPKRPAKPDEAPYVFAIDEINRGNVAAIFGELMTLIETDKRLGGPEERTVTLPYSGETNWGVPGNVYIIGTMNTADRSLTQLDSALRRRFDFEEVMPDYGALRVHLANSKEGADLLARVDVPRMLAAINQRICALYDRDHELGHSYLWNCTDLDDLREAFHSKVIPMLQEYFYEDYDRIRAVLNDSEGAFVGVDDQEEALDIDWGEFNLSDSDLHERFRVVDGRAGTAGPVWSERDFVRIYDAKAAAVLGDHA